MARIMLVVGGCRSGKSAYAQRLAESLPPPRLFLATCPVIDEEMARRIEAHQSARRDRGWETVEEPLDVAAVLARQQPHHVLLLDCVTLWVNNLMYAAESRSEGTVPIFAGTARAPSTDGRPWSAKMGLSPCAPFGEVEITGECRKLLAAARARAGHVILVSNEVGMGIVPENPSARRFRDLVGRANQEIAGGADAVTLVCCGIPQALKGER
jgi:adenosylcobinamide kinase/adenosylcobinamide-phosphate guanylyltransferase